MSLLDVKLTLLSHNLVRGAAGAALLNAETLASRGFFISRAGCHAGNRRCVFLAAHFGMSSYNPHQNK